MSKEMAQRKGIEKFLLDTKFGLQECSSMMPHHPHSFSFRFFGGRTTKAEHNLQKGRKNKQRLGSLCILDYGFLTSEEEEANLQGGTKSVQNRKYYVIFGNYLTSTRLILSLEESQ